MQINGSKAPKHVAIRWTIGDVHEHGFEALRLSIWGAWRLFGSDAEFAVCVNTISVERARALTGPLPDGVRWHRVSKSQVPRFIRRRLDPEMAEGAAWKLSPIRLFPEAYELSLDNDCILWRKPEALRSLGGRAVLAEDVERSVGQFDDFCDGEARNAGIRGTPAGLNLSRAMRDVLRDTDVTLRSELDEQGLQVAALSRRGPVRTVRLDEVTICSPFPPHLPKLGTCGAHFVGLNAKRLPWDLGGRSPVEILGEHWNVHRKTVYERVGIEPE